jgi:hypothetical protein
MDGFVALAMTRGGAFFKKEVLAFTKFSRVGLICIKAGCGGGF